MKRMLALIALLSLSACTYSEKTYYIRACGSGNVTIKTDDAISAEKTPTVNPNIEIPLIK